jgi:NADH:ubiquinone oxidoreductase subunit F (NADH-binding)
MRAAILDARERGVLGDFDVEVLVGAGCYVAGEETALLRSIEGLRAEPAPKPPYPAVRGLHGLPTVVQNVETLSMVPFIARRPLANGSGRIDTKAVCVSGAVAAPGVIEVELGTPLRRVLDEGAGGASTGKRWKMALVGGPLGRVVPVAGFDVPLSFEALPGMGHAGIVVFDESVSPRALVEHLFEFARSESCGTCAPCRIGTAQLAACRSRASLERLLTTIGDGSLCGFGQGVPRPVLDLLAAFGDEVLG